MNLRQFENVCAQVTNNTLSNMYDFLICSKTGLNINQYTLLFFEWLDSKWQCFINRFSQPLKYEI